MEPITIALIGAGNRGGDAYGGWVLRHPELARVTAVAEPNPERRRRIAEMHGVAPERIFASWEELLAGGRPADAVIVATPDHMHVEPTLRALELGCDVLLEKPIAPTREQVQAVADAVAGVPGFGGARAAGSGVGSGGSGAGSGGSGAGPGVGSGAGPGVGSETGSGVGSETGSGVGLETGSGVGSETGSGVGSGGSGAGSGVGSETGSGAGSRVGSETGPGVGSETGSGARSRAGWGTGPGADRNADPGADGPSVTVAHVLRYTPFFTTLKRLLDEGRIGRLMTIQYTENIGYWHFAHSYVRGNWRRLDQSSPMILAKSCHDLDMLRWLAGAPCRQVASFGELSWFRKENKPEGAPPRCSDGCPVGDECPFNAVTFYVEGLADHHGWPVSVISTDTSEQGRLRALREGPYGRCVYQSDNDVVDHQVTVLQFENGVTATFNVAGFTEENTRTLKLMGSHGEIRGHLDKGELEIRTFGRPGLRNGSLRSAEEYELVHTSSGPGHAGGDAGLMAAFVERIRRRKKGDDPGEMRTSLLEALESHFMAFAAERSRTGGTVVTLDT